MLKLMKYEFIQSIRTYSTVFGVFLIGCLVAPFLIDIGPATNETFSSVISFITMLVGFFLVIGIFLALIIGIFTRYNSSMFKRPGYLTLTLPISTTQLILSKVLTTAIWLMISSLVMVVGFIIFFTVLIVVKNILPLSYFLDSLKLALDNMWIYISQHITILLLNIFSMGAQLLLLIGSIYFSMTVVRTRLFRNRQVLIGVCIYILLNIMVGVMAVFIFPEGIGLSVDLMDNIYSVNEFIYFLQSLYYFVIGSILIAATIYVIDNHIEIE